MDKKEKLQQLLKRKEKADSLTTQEKLRWKDAIIQLEQEIKDLRQEIKQESMTEEEAMILNLFALNKTAIQYLYEKLMGEGSNIIEEFIDEITASVYDYFQTKEREHLEKAKLVQDTLLESLYQNYKGKIEKEKEMQIDEDFQQLGFQETKEFTP
ncbi:MAG: hypothetical protein JJT76_06360 [Clostridiaceae bacterium]|nr:hypothetical protein [Clostridiaceae bacterium]